jgi:integrase
MPPETASVRAADPSARDYLAEYAHHQTRTGRGNHTTTQGAKTFMRRWPNPQDWAAQPLAYRLAEGSQTTSFLIFLMVHGWLQPGYDYLVSRKLSSFWREIAASPRAVDMQRFRQGAEAIGFTSIQSLRIASQSVGRLLIETNVSLEQLTLDDFEALTRACRRRGLETGKGWRHYQCALSGAHRVLFHMGILDVPPSHWQQPQAFAHRVVDVHPALQAAFVAYLERKSGTCKPKTVTGTATRLVHFGRFLAEHDPELASLADLDRQRHIEPYLNSVANAINSKNGEPITTADQARRILTLSVFLNDVTEWGWKDAPKRRLIFRTDTPRLPRPLPRYLPVDADRRLGEALARSEFRLAADALLLARACGLRIGELLDLELDCVHEVPGNGAWLKVPLGKLDTERMVPLDEETVTLIDRICATRSEGRALAHPRTGRPAQFLFTHHGRRLGQQALRLELNRAAEAAGIGHVKPHQLRHTFATAMVNAGVSLQALMALLGHVSAEMSLRYGRLFDTTVRAEYERALELAKSQLGQLPKLPNGRTRIPVTGDGDWRDAPAIKARLAGGYCLRAPAQGSCPYANICEHCPNFRTDAASVSVLSAQRTDAEALAADAESRGWIDEADRHRRLISRLDALLAEGENLAG